MYAWNFYNLMRCYLSNSKQSDTDTLDNCLNCGGGGWLRDGVIAARPLMPVIFRSDIGSTNWVLFILFLILLFELRIMFMQHSHADQTFARSPPQFCLILWN
jgi:hypothetical protein